MKQILRWSLAIVVLLGLGYCTKAPTITPIPLTLTVEAQTLPATVKIGIDPPTDSPSGYNVTQDGGASTFVPLPTATTCNDYFTNAASTCVPFSFTFTTAGAHTITIASVSAGGASTAVPLTFNLTVPAPAAHLHITK